MNNKQFQAEMAKLNVTTAPNFHPRRHNFGSPTGQERRAVMYSGRRDHLKPIEPRPETAAAPESAPAPKKTRARKPRPNVAAAMEILGLPLDQYSQIRRDMSDRSILAYARNAQKRAANDPQPAAVVFPDHEMRTEATEDINSLSMLENSINEMFGISHDSSAPQDMTDRQKLAEIMTLLAKALGNRRAMERRETDRRANGVTVPNAPPAAILDQSAPDIYDAFRVFDEKWSASNGQMAINWGSHSAKFKRIAHDALRRGLTALEANNYAARIAYNGRGVIAVH